MKERTLYRLYSKNESFLVRKIVDCSFNDRFYNWIAELLEQELKETVTWSKQVNGKWL